MFDQFEKLRDFESDAGQSYADWNALQDRLDKPKKKRFVWFIFGGATMLVLTFVIGQIYFNTDSISNSMKLALNDDGIGIETETTPSESNNTIPGEKQVLESSNRTTLSASYSITAPEGYISTPETVDGLTDDGLLTMMTPLPLTDLSPEIKPQTIANREFEAIPEPEKKETVYPNYFDLEFGVKSSISNSISNVTSPNKAWGTGFFVNANYNVGRYLSFGFGTGIQSEFKQDLNYSFITESRSFFDRSDKMLNINTTQMYSANFLLTSNFRWNKRLVTGGGIYYNYIFQTMSNVHESGTGAFADIGGPIEKKTGYTDLLNNHELGFYISQTCMLNDSWGLSLSFRKGFTNRINTAYFPGIESKRTELSLMISKRIRL